VKPAEYFDKFKDSERPALQKLGHPVSSRWPTHDPFSGVVPDRRGSDRVDADDPLLWWWADYDEQEGGTHEDLRIWLQARYEDGLRGMVVELIRDGDHAPDVYQIVLNGSRARQNLRPLQDSEHEWLLRAWPEELRTPGLRSSGVLAL
jgi:hypothetical protein